MKFIQQFIYFAFANKHLILETKIFYKSIDLEWSSTAIY